jgi:hypothetical protein
MMEDIAVEITESLIELFKLEDWFVGVRNFLPEVDEDPDEPSPTKGCCTYSTKSIALMRRHLAEASDADILETITHEIAHAVLGEGFGHGDVFKLMHKQVHQRSMNHILNTFGK